MAIERLSDAALINPTCSWGRRTRLYSRSSRKCNLEKICNNAWMKALGNIGQNFGILGKEEKGE
jgi:hypothetical protein